jgi:multiple sugar transport system ATP-binding protein
MGALSIRNVRKSFGAVSILKGIDIEIEEGEFLILVGPSGCGKSTLLSMIAGLDVPTTGSIHIGDRDVTHELPKDRDIAMVFQSYALYPNMNVAENIAFALEMRKVPKAERAAAVERVAAMLQIGHLLDRKPGQLSGGQRQRVAMGRALARNPKLFLFDEPLSNLDAKLRVEMRAEIKLLHQRTRTTTVYVTHDQVEAMTLGDRIAVMRDGMVQQFGTPDDIYTRPATRFVAEFIGSPAMNMLAVDAAGPGGKGLMVNGVTVTPFTISPSPPSSSMRSMCGRRRPPPAWSSACARSACT